MDRDSKIFYVTFKEDVLQSEIDQANEFANTLAERGSSFKRKRPSGYQEKFLLKRTNYFAWIMWVADKCIKCATKDDLTIDHIRPLIKGGDNSISNIQYMCQLCNSLKGGTEVDYRVVPEIYADSIREKIRLAKIKGDHPTWLFIPDPRR